MAPHRVPAFLFPAAFARVTNRVAAVMRLQVIHMRVWLAEGLRSEVICVATNRKLQSLWHTQAEQHLPPPKQ